MGTATPSAPLPDPRVLARLGEHLAAGFFEEPDAAPVRRMARGMRRHLEHRAPPAWSGEKLYPGGSYALWESQGAVHFSYARSLHYDPGVCERLRQVHPTAAPTLAALDSALRSYPMVGASLSPEFRLGGAGFTHSIPHYGRVCREGLDGYRERIDRRLLRAREQDEREAEDLCLALLDLLEGIGHWHAACVETLRSVPVSDEEQRRHRDALVRALERVPFGPAEDFLQALLSINFVFYLDGCDSLGRLDQDLGPYYAADRQRGTIQEDEATAWIRALWENMDANSAWNVALGGSDAQGLPAYNELTGVALRAARGIRRPNLALRIRRDTPPEIFELALDAIASGCGIPALYNEEGYLRALRAAHLNIREGDLRSFAFGGCTETMMHGMSNVGSLDAGLNLLQILTGTLDRELERATDFEALWTAYLRDLEHAIERLVREVDEDQRIKARWQPQPMRSLLVDDCIQAGREYNAGGARYNWSVINVGGLANAVDSLIAVRERVFSRQEIPARRLREALRADFRGYEDLLPLLTSTPRFGNDEAQVDALAAELSTFVFGELHRYAPWRGGRFLPACLMFTTYARAGEQVPASPDGRRAEEPIADSAGPYQGRDRSGPTAMLRSCSVLDQASAPGTLVVNIRFSPRMFAEPDQRSRLVDLIRTYFALGGFQLQINVVDQQVLREAMAHPEKHQDLVVRVGGYSEYFHRLSPALQESILLRTEHE